MAYAATGWAALQVSFPCLFLPPSSLQPFGWKQPPGMRYFCFPGVFLPLAVALLAPQMCNSPHSLPAASALRMLSFPASDSPLCADTWTCDSIPVAIKYTVLGLKRNEGFDFRGCQTSGPSSNTIRKLADAVKPSSFFSSWHKQNI